MTATYGTSIPRKDLVLCYDPTNIKSYPGSGNQLYDLSGRSKTGTMSAVAFDGKHLNFDGTSSSISFDNPLNQSNLTQVWTVLSWINITDKVSQTLVGGLNNGCSVCYVQGNNSLLYLNGGTNDYYTYGGDLGGVGWTQATFRFDNTSGARTIYRDKYNISTGGPNSTSTPSGQAATFFIGGGSLQGKIGMFLVYSRYLTDAEVIAVYYSLKSRYI